MSFASWRYAPADKRDLRIDFLRGVAICSMVINHLASASYLNELSMRRFYASGAEGFVFLSGFVLGSLQIQRMAREGFGGAARKLLHRAWILYRTSFVLVAVLGLLSLVVPHWTRPAFAEAPAGALRLLWAAATFHLNPPVIDILQLYVICLALAPAALWLLARGMWAPLLAASAGLWIVQYLHPYAFSLQPLNRDHVYFTFAAWQLLFFVGFTAGYHREALRARWARLPLRVLVPVLVLACAAFTVACFHDEVRGDWPVGFGLRGAWSDLTDRSTMGPLRVLNLIVLFPLLLIAVDRFWKPLSATVGKVLVPLGQNSLYVYLMHIPLVLLWTGLAGSIAPVRILAALGQVAMLLLLWAFVRRQFLFQVVPR